MGRAQQLNPNRPRDGASWRTGRPAEDPEKTKRWGFVTAKPSEFLVHVRGGTVRSRSSGQGATCFKLPWDSVAVVPTSLQRLRFVADQVTREKVGVEVTGLAVYRIVEPLLAFRVLNFSYPERAQEKLEETLTAMLVGATRRLVANLSVEEVLQKRKSAVADELLGEVAPVIGGQGRLEDATAQGWGVVLDTIEVQEVRVLSEQVFSAMQAPYRAELERRAFEARSRAQLTEVETRRDVETAKHLANAEVHSTAAGVQQDQAERESAARIKEQQRKQQEAEARLEVHEVMVAALRADHERAALELDEERARREASAAILRLEGEASAEVAARRAQVALTEADARARVVTAERLPELAQVLGSKVGEVRITQLGGSDENPYRSLTEAIAGLVEMTRR